MTDTLKQRAYEHIRQKLISGKLRPGSKLSHRALAREIGISFIPVREAISQLTSEGLVDHKPGLGTFVVQVSRREMEELYDLRLALESHAAECAAGRITDVDLESMRSQNQTLWSIVRELKPLGREGWTIRRLDRWMVADAALHLALLRAAGNRRAIKVVSDLRIMTYIFGHRVGAWPIDDLVRVCTEHDRLIDALAAGEPKLARTIMAEHLRTGCRIIVQEMERRGTQLTRDESLTVSYPAVLRHRIERMELDSAAEADRDEDAPE